MPFLDDPVPVRLLWPPNAVWPKRRLSQIIRQFRGCFTNIDYEARPLVDVANAQAIRLGGRRCVLIYGGLTRHRLIGSTGLAVVLAHETGHHVGGPPYLPFLRWLSSEERADEWARAVGLPTVYGDRASAVWLTGNRQLENLGFRLDDLRALPDAG
jgi:hypothetical protein